MSNVQKGRYWAFVGYPESLPDDWLDFLQNTGLPFAISPLHDRDTNPDGEHKKEHYHIILCYDGPTTYGNVKRITDHLHCPIPIKLESVRGYYRYFTHKDNPEKFQYDEAFTRCFNGFCPADYSNLTNVELRKIRNSILDTIRLTPIYEYADLVMIYQDQDPPEAMDYICTHTIFFKAFLDSYRHKPHDTEHDDF